MVTESWFSSLWRASWKNVSEPEKKVIGVLAFEVASLMSKVVYLWQILSDKQIFGLRKDILNSVGIRNLVSDDDDFLLGLVCSEIIENLISVVKPVAMLGKRCTEPVLHLFEHEFDNLVTDDANLYAWEFTWKKMERKVKKMEKFIAASATLCQELEVLAELEQTLRRRQVSGIPNQVSLLEFQKRVFSQQQDVKNLQEICPWNRTYDYTVRLLARSLFTIFGRTRHIFGINQMVDVGGIKESKTTSARYLPRSHSVAAFMQLAVHPSSNNLARVSSGPLGRSTSNLGSNSGTSEMRNRQWQTSDHLSTLHGKYPYSKTKWLAPVGPFKGCMMGGDDSPVLQSCMPVSSGYPRWNVVYSGVLSGTKGIERLPCAEVHHTNLSIFSSKFRLLNAPPSTLGASALALHYANVITVIEKLVASPYLMGPDARDDLYNMLPTSVRGALRSRLKSYTKNWTRYAYDAVLAGEWSKALEEILEWLTPLAHNMIRWQSERNFEQRHLVSKTNVLLVQTLYFANQVKTEAAITELLVGLNYIWRFQRERNANANMLLECANSRACYDYLDPNG